MTREAIADSLDYADGLVVGVGRGKAGVAVLAVHGWDVLYLQVALRDEAGVEEDWQIESTWGLGMPASWLKPWKTLSVFSL